MIYHTHQTKADILEALADHPDETPIYILVDGITRHEQKIPGGSLILFGK